MQRYVAQRLLLLIPVLLVISALVFSLMHLIPGDPAQVILGFENTDPVQLEAVRRDLGLDRPVYVQYGRWLSRVARGQFGTSVRTGRPIGTLLGEALPFTIELALYAVLLAMLIGIPVGTLAGTTRSRAADGAMQTLTLLGLSLPAFWVGAMFILLFSVHLRWFPVLSYPPLATDPLANLRGFFLPALTLAVPNAAAIARMVRASMVAVRGEEYVKAARAKGLSEVLVVRRHMLKNALIPVVTLIGIVTGYLLGGAIVVEQVFAIPGVGRMGLQAIVQRDYPVLQAVVLAVAGLFVLVNLVVDLIYVLLDPRIRYS
ncbi:MAG: ABC transporter permease [Armatimonadota bacterium]|nr:ABC transporter permease [Armatimonadota bacterium]MDR7450744.1 ABC transporter permease [Armatimonadota bacterium]MDR7466100.1 ABC transporter permease [Armatimonadota bacterium]MDR7493863.1 ABC transporter permease [Armatimonadota bacterium]MDR7498976.1 ABC transporter permease [Armatimonadota bacterium]